MDHLVPHNGDDKLFKATGNHIPLCERDHNTVTSLFDRKYKVGDSVEGKVKWLNDLRNKNQTIRDETFHRVRVIPFDEKY